MKRIFILLAIFATITGASFAQDVAIKTNLLYGGLTYTPNLGVEIGLGKKTTLDVSAGYNPWNYDKHEKKLAHLLGEVEFRYWFKERFRGVFVGVHALGVRYNIAGHNLPMIFGKGSDEYQYQGHAYGGGVSFGYQFKLAKKWNLELNIGVGYARFNYDKYDCKNCGRFVESSFTNFFGPTRAGVSIIFLIDGDKSKNVQSYNRSLGNR